jgi:hypothetical protein
MKQITCIDQDVTGNSNWGDQSAITISAYNCLTEAAMLQSIEEIMETVGSDNGVDQKIKLRAVDNVMTGGLLIQDSTVTTNV